MKEEIEKIFKPKKGLIIVLLIFLAIATVCIGSVFYEKYKQTKDPVDFAQQIINKSEEENLYASIDIAYLPQLIAVTPERENCLYFIMDTEDNLYIARLSNKTYNYLKSIYNEENQKLSTTYNLKGYTKLIDIQIKDLALRESKKVLPNEKLNSDNFSQKIGTIYITENMYPKNSRQTTAYTCIALTGVFFLILAVLYIIPFILRERKFLKNEDLVNELKNELSNLTDNPYEQIKVYLTNRYIFSMYRGKQIIKYEDIVWGEIYIHYTYLIETGRNLIVCTKDNKKHTIASVGAGNNVLENVLSDIKSKNPNIKVGNSKK